MSLELHAFVTHETLPDRLRWQTALDSLGLSVKLHPDLDLSRDSGFSPCILNAEESGFEVSVDSVDELLAAYPKLRSEVGRSRHVISFRWGGDMRECACVLAAVAALITEFGAVAFDPQEEEFNDVENLLGEFNKVLKHCVS